MERNRKHFGRRAWLMRAAVLGATVAFSAGAPVTGVPATPVGAGVEASGEEIRERVLRFGRFRLCWSSCPGYGWCCYDNPHV